MLLLHPTVRPVLRHPHLNPVNNRLVDTAVFRGYALHSESAADVFPHVRPVCLTNQPIRRPVLLELVFVHH